MNVDPEYAHLFPAWNARYIAHELEFARALAFAETQADIDALPTIEHPQGLE